MNERRQSPRVVLEKEVIGRTRTSAPVRILDISAGGMRVESASPLAPTKRIDAWLPTPTGEIRVSALVLRCRARAVPPSAEREGGLVYHAALQFQNLDPTTEDHLKTAFLNESSLTLKGIFAAVATS
jgi:hypothetical protein